MTIKEKNRKVMITRPYDLSDYNINYDISKVYLAYVKSKGFVLFHETDYNTWLYSIEEHNTDTEMFLNNWTNTDKEIVKLRDIFNTRVIPDYNKKLEHKVNSGVNYDSNQLELDKDNIFTEVIGTLLYDLQRIIETDNFTRLQDLNTGNNTITRFYLTPEKTFNKYLEPPDPLNYHDFKAKKESITEDLKQKATELFTIYNKYHNLQGYTDSKHKKIGTLLEDKAIFNVINDLLNEVGFDNPIYSLNYGKGSEKVKQLRATNELVKELHIKRHIKDGSSTIYYFNDNLNYFQKLDKPTLQYLVPKVYGIDIAKKDITAIYDNINTNDTLHNNLLVFDNILYDIDMLEEFNFPICNYNRKHYLTDNIIGVKDKDTGNINLLTFNDGLSYPDDINTVKPLPTNEDLIEDMENNLSISEYPKKYGMTLTELTLRQILIPKDNPTDLRMFIDYLERLGSCILKRNQFKTITFYFDEVGNSGKSCLNMFFDLIYNDNNQPVKPEQFKDQFGAKELYNKNCINVDEINENSFFNMLDTLKRMSSPYSKDKVRNMREETFFTINYYPNMYFFVNELIPLDVKKHKAVFKRFDFLKTPNIFVEKKELNKYPNAWLENPLLYPKLREDKEGLNWLASAMILAYKIMMARQIPAYTLKQTTNESIDIYLSTNELIKFLVTYTELAPPETPSNDYVRIKEIKSKFLEYLELKNTDYKTNTLDKDIGKELRNLYGINKDNEKQYFNNTGGAKYRVKLKDFNEVENEYKQIYCINEFVSDKQLELLSYSNDNKLVYNKIQAGYNTINKLNKELRELDNYNIVKQLESQGLIENTFNTSLD